mmetsp:Transcript_19927/g.28820  ORF Transcript_19927/g.28820 Transcript_19927/m.28820 type:complete len:90 (+) Transcript_19927:1647-1916(+)
MPSTIGRKYQSHLRSLRMKVMLHCRTNQQNLMEWNQWRKKNALKKCTTWRRLDEPLNNRMNSPRIQKFLRPIFGNKADVSCMAQVHQIL